MSTRRRCYGHSCGIYQGEGWQHPVPELPGHHTIWVTLTVGPRGKANAGELGRARRGEVCLDRFDCPLRRPGISGFIETPWGDPWGNQ